MALPPPPSLKVRLSSYWRSAIGDSNLRGAVLQHAVSCNEQSLVLSQDAGELHFFFRELLGCLLEGICKDPTAWVITELRAQIVKPGRDCH